MTAFSKRIAATAAAAALTAGGVFAVATPAFAATTTPTATDEAVEAQLVVDSLTLESGTTAVNWAATGLEPGVTYTVELVAPEGTSDVTSTAGNAYTVNADGTTSGKTSRDDNSPFTDGDYTLTVTPTTGDALTTTFVVGPQATETPEPTETATPEPTETETPEPTGTPEPTDTETPAPTETEEPTPTATETEAEEAPALAIEQDTYTQSETLSGVNYAGAGWAPGVEITIEVTEPNGSTTVISPVGDPESDIAVDENGEFAGTVTYTTYEDTNGNGQYDAGEPSSAQVLPIGDYTITATQEDVTETISFSVVADASESIPASDDEDTSNNNSGSNGDSLAVTGADDAALLGMLAGGLVLVAAGATTMVVRRRQS